MLHRILGGIYLSSIEPINAGIDLKNEYKITHILSVVPGPIPAEYTTNYIFKQIEVTDEETTNIIQYFESSYEFIDDALFKNSKDPKKHSGNVLVHCSQGVSRSVTIIIAYLMKKYKLAIDQALHAVTRKVPEAQPNAGFMEQLVLYKDIDFKVDVSNELYRQFVVDNSLKMDPSGSSLRDLNLFKVKEEKEEGSKDFELRCKRCRQALALNDNIEAHDPPDSESRQSQFIKKAPNSRRIISVQEASSSCSHHFLSDPVNWMKPELEREDIEGKFLCPKCDAKVGGYSWKGSRCSCGKWMVPAIHLQVAKVDCIKSIPQLHTLSHPS
ncbi:nitrogen starvation-induced protein phosphatase [Scheffersomyces xylosifermentans]|uniref:nitrogen starvation-induced protein phosphatase n=1 Tax=Scheffersomyces xylosifermentans TaxID=1304137 RepID=UPI00315D42B1